MPNPVLQASDIKKNFGNITAVAGISLSVESGQCVALLGPNGAGKTTTVEMLEGLQKPDHGNITVFGKALSSHRRAIAEDVGVMLQETSLYKKYTVFETLKLFSTFFKKSLPPQTVIDRLNLTEKTNTRLEALSGGQKQRVYLGCALINDPKLLFLDEPTTGLDPQARRLLWDLLLRLKADDKAILLTTHYMDEAEKLADRVLVVDHGKIIADGSPRQLIHDICGDHILDFSFNPEHNDQDNQRLVEKLPWIRQATRRGHHYEVVTANPADQLKDLVRVSDSLDLNLINLWLRSPTLEDVFIKLTGRSIRDD